jgi:hypothetical protein
VRKSNNSGRFNGGSGRGGGGMPRGEYNHHRKPLRRRRGGNFPCDNFNKKDNRLSITSSPKLPKTPKMNECTTIETMVNVAFDNYLHADCELLRDIAAFWSTSPKILAQHAVDEGVDDIGKIHDKKNTLMRLVALRNHTVKQIEMFTPADFTKSFVALAKLYTLLHKRNDENERDDIVLFRSLLLDTSGYPKENPFQFFLYSSIPLLPRLSPRDLACVSYSTILIKDSALNDVYVVVDSIASEVSSRVNHFDSRSLSRILFDVAKSGRPQQLLRSKRLFSVASRYLCELDLNGCAPSEMANILYSFATSHEANTAIFRKIANAILSQYTSATRLAWYNPSDLIRIMWSFARAEIVPSDEFQRKIKNALFQKLIRIHDAIFTLDDFSDLIWALSKAFRDNSSLLMKIESRINLAMKTSQYQASSLATLAWTCCDANIQLRDVFSGKDSLFMTACVDEADNFCDEDLRKLYAFHLWQQQLNCDGLPSSLHDKCFEAQLLPSNLLSEYD